MNKKNIKEKKIVVNVQTSQTPFVYWMQKAPLFICIMGMSIAVTMGIVLNWRSIPNLITTFKNAPLFSTPQKKINLDKVFLSPGDQYVDPLLVKSIIDTKNSEWIFVDYRSSAEFNASHIKGAVNIPLYGDYKMFLETAIPLNEWYGSYWKLNKNGKKVLLYGYWDQSKLATDIKQFLNTKGEKFFLLKMGFYEFKNNFYQWAPGGDMNTISVAAYLEGSLVAPVAPFDGVPANPTTK